MIAIHQEPRSKDGQQSQRHYNYKKLGNYCRDADHEGEKCLMSWYAGCNAPDYDLALEEIKATQAMNTRAQGDKTYHLEICFRPEDEAKLTPEVYQRIECAFAEALGLSEHQRVCGVHKNTANLHMHVAYNLIHPETFTMATTLFYDYPKLSKACRAMEQEFGLMVDNGYDERNTQELKISQCAAAMEAHSGEQSFQSYALVLRDAVVRRMALAKNWEETHEILADYGMAIQPKSNGLVVVPLTGEGSLKASALDKSMSRMRLEKRFGTFIAPEQASAFRPEPEPLAVEQDEQVEATTASKAEEQPFHAFVLEQKDHILKALKDAKSWQDVHQALADHGITVKPRGNGLVLAGLAGKETMKASELDRGMSKKHLEDQFGPFAGPDASASPGRQAEAEQSNSNESARETYQKKPRQPKSPERDQLYKEYQAALAEKIARIDEEKARSTASHGWLKEKWQKMKGDLYATTYSHRTRTVRMRMMLNLHRQDVAREKADHKAAMAEIKADYPWYNWNGYLQHQATQGNTVALGVLRSMEERKAAQDAIKNPAREKTFLEVQFDDRQAVKEAGAKWDPQAKQWYAPKGADLDKFTTWLPASKEQEPDADPGRSENEKSEKAEPAAPAQATPKEKKTPGERLAFLTWQEKERIKAGSAQKSFFSGCSYRIDNRGVAIITLVSGGTIRDAGKKLHFSPDEDSRQAARLYAMAKFGKHFTEKDNSMEMRGNGKWRLLKPHLGILKECARYGLRTLSQLPVVRGRHKPEVLLQGHAHDDMER